METQVSKRIKGKKIKELNKVNDELKLLILMFIVLDPACLYLTYIAKCHFEAIVSKQ